MDGWCPICKMPHSGVCQNTNHDKKTIKIGVRDNGEQYIMKDFHHSLELFPNKNQIREFISELLGNLENTTSEPGMTLHLASIIGFCSTVLYRSGGNPHKVVSAALEAGEIAYNQVKNEKTH